MNSISVGPIRIALISSYPPIECGIATYTQRLRRGFDNDKTVEHFVVSHIGGAGKEVFPVIPPGSSSFGADVYDVSLSLTPDLVHIQHEYGLYGNLHGVAILDLLHRYRVADLPTITTLHTVGAEASQGELKILGGIAELSTRLIVHEEFQREWLRGRLGSSVVDKTHVVHHGVREAVEPRVHEFDLVLDSGPVMLICGFLRPSKGHHRMVELLPKILEVVPGATLLIAIKARRCDDYPEYRQRLSRLIEESPARSSIRVMQGQFPEAVLDRIISLSNVVLLPYEYGTQSGILADAFALGRPVVASSLPGFEAVVERSGGGFCASSDQEYVEAIGQLLQDSGSYEQCQEGIQRYISEVAGWRVVARQHLQLYNSTIRNIPKLFCSESAWDN